MVNFDLDSIFWANRLRAVDLAYAACSGKRERGDCLLTTEECIREEVATLSKNERAKDFMIFYHYDGFCYHTFDSERMLQLSLVGQQSVCSQMCKRLKKCVFCAVYYRKGKKWLPLWVVKGFDAGSNPEYLNLKKLKRKLKLVFNDFTIKLGEFRENEATKVKFIAWQVTTDKGEVYYIPWHSGALIPALDEYVFVEKDFRSMRSTTYDVLRFGEMREVSEEHCYGVRCY